MPATNCELTLADCKLTVWPRGYLATRVGAGGGYLNVAADEEEDGDAASIASSTESASGFTGMDM